MYAVLGHKHTGTTCLAKCLQMAGVSFGTNCNSRMEDCRLFVIYPERVKFLDMIWHERATAIVRNVEQDEDVQAVKHPYLSSSLEHWSTITSCIATIRSPLAWVKRWKNTSYKEGIQSWLKAYEPIANMNIPMIHFDSPTLEEDMQAALLKLGLVYKGGVDIKKRQHARPYEEIPRETRITWGKLHHGIQRTRQ